MKDFPLSHIFLWSERKTWVKVYYVTVRKVKIQNVEFILLWFCSVVALLIATLFWLSYWLLIRQQLPVFSLRGGESRDWKMHLHIKESQNGKISVRRKKGALLIFFFMLYSSRQTVDRQTDTWSERLLTSALVSNA